MKLTIDHLSMMSFNELKNLSAVVWQ